MEQLHNGFTLEAGGDGFPLSTDSMVLAHFARLPRQARVLDFGSGCGTLGLLLCADDPGCSVTGLEIDPAAHAVAQQNIERNGLSGRMESICADLRSFTGSGFPVCISNPPYFSGGFSSQTLATARQEGCCTPEDLFRCGSHLLKFGGDFFLVHKPERLAELIATAARYKLEAKRLCLVRHRADAPVNLILLQLRKGAKPGLQWEEMILHHADGSPTDLYKEIYHI